MYTEKGCLLLAVRTIVQSGSVPDDGTMSIAQDSLHNKPYGAVQVFMRSCSCIQFESPVPDQEAAQDQHPLQAILRSFRLFAERLTHNKGMSKIAMVASGSQSGLSPARAASSVGAIHQQAHEAFTDDAESKPHNYCEDPSVKTSLAENTLHTSVNSVSAAPGRQFWGATCRDRNIHCRRWPFLHPRIAPDRRMSRL